MYDGFDHVFEHRKLTDTGALATTRYVFDPLDRTVSKTTGAGTAGAETTEFAYLGLTGQLLEEIDAATDAVQARYTYSATGERLGQSKKTSAGAWEDSFYGYNAHSDVETLTKQDGSTRATYGYSAYGSDDTARFTGVDKPTVGEPGAEGYNVYRFNAKRWDAASGVYDMGFRDYDPGLNRFTTRDMYNGALADLNLAADPFNGNRYGFAGGNPINRIELDGHRPIEGEWWEMWQDRHETAVDLRTAQLRRDYPDARITVSRADNIIAGGSSVNPGDENGYADIIMWTEGVVFVFEMKNAGGDAERRGPAQVANYVKYLQRQLRAEDRAEVVLAGPASTDTQVGPNRNFLRQEMIYTYASNLGGGTEVYTAQHDPRLPTYGPIKLPEKEGMMDRRRNSLMPGVMFLIPFLFMGGEIANGDGGSGCGDELLAPYMGCGQARPS
ncbi:RHS repeat-associated core domain-containing protein [Intrasporangium calvum]|uniref:RHS repeat-associated core domain-containing protein n=1 Tax=Intrasporangium calvum TaxID=53358 RepID=UPI000DF608CA|nr:RHS repeat-associated core domain-containing protein [Intrasporangium calvum]AXG13829.1 RHS repeat-associated core domain-containing protein [Intrasporangium calvum]